MQSLITGASGFIGANLMAALVREGKVRALTRLSGSMPGAVTGDLLDKESLQAACAGMECVFHCAGYAHAFASADPAKHWRINFEGTRNLVEAAAAAGVRRFVFLSSVKAMAEPDAACADEDWPGEPETPYGKAKRAAEAVVLETAAGVGMHAVNFRLAMVYGRGGRGNLERMARGIRAGWFPPLPETGNRRSLVHVADVVGAMRLAAESPKAGGKTYIVADPRAYSGREIYDAVCRATGREPPARRVPAGVLRAAGRLGDMLGGVVSLASGKPLPLNSEVVSRLLDSACYCPARVEADLGWRPQYDLATGLREMLG